MLSLVYVAERKVDVGAVCLQQLGAWKSSGAASALGIQEEI